MNAPNFKGIIFEYFALTNIYVHGHDINMYMKMTRTSMPLISTTENRELVSQRSNLVVCGFKIWWIEKRIYIGLEKTSNWFFFNFDHLIGNNGWLLVKKASLTPKSMGSRSMKFKENSPIMIQGILKGNSWKISIFKSTSRVTFSRILPSRTSTWVWHTWKWQEVRCHWSQQLKTGCWLVKNQTLSWLEYWKFARITLEYSLNHSC